MALIAGSGLVMAFVERRKCARRRGAARDRLKLLSFGFCREAESWRQTIQAENRLHRRGPDGHGIAKNLVTKGSLTVRAHRNRGPVDDLIAKGAKEAKRRRM